MTGARAWVLGNAVVDWVASPLHELPAKDRSVRVESLVKSPGGCGVHVATHLARHGIHTALIARVGNDDEGRYLRQSLAKEGVDTSAVRTDNQEDTGVCLGLRGPNDDAWRSFISRPGANLNLKPSDLPKQEPPPRVIHFTGLAGCHAFCAANMMALLSSLAEETTVSLDVTWSHARDWNWPPEIFRHIDLFMPNEEEARAITKADTMESAASTLRQWGVSVVLLTRGALGVYVDGPHGSLTLAPPRGSRPVSPVGAGDAFAAAYLASVVELGPDALDSDSLRQRVQAAMRYSRDRADTGH